MASDYHTVLINNNRNIKTKFPNAIGHIVHRLIIIPWVVLVWLELLKPEHLNFNPFLCHVRACMEFGELPERKHWLFALLPGCLLALLVVCVVAVFAPVGISPAIRASLLSGQTGASPDRKLD